jgi:predicted dehydrogenase
MPYRAAVIGCGKIGSEFDEDPRAAAYGVCTHAGAYAACRDTELVALGDTDPAKVERCGRRWGVAARYRDPRRLLAEQRPEIVSICTPDPTHSELLRMALLADGVRAILAEKPLALSLPEAEELVGLARRRGVVLAVNYSRRHDEHHGRLRDLIRAGGIGEIRTVLGLYTKGTLHNGTHWFDLARFLLGEVRRVAGRDRLHEGGDDPTYDAQLEFGGDVVASLYGCSARDYTVFEFDLVGSRGRVRVVDSGAAMEFYEVVEGMPFAGYRALALKQRLGDGLRNVPLRAVEDLVDCLGRNGVPRCSGDDGVRALRIALAVAESAATGQVVEVSER